MSLWHLEGVNQQRRQSLFDPQLRFAQSQAFALRLEAFCDAVSEKLSTAA